MVNKNKFIAISFFSLVSAFYINNANASQFSAAQLDSFLSEGANLKKLPSIEINFDVITSLKNTEKFVLEYPVLKYKKPAIVKNLSESKKEDEKDQKTIKIISDNQIKEPNTEEKIVEIVEKTKTPSVNNEKTENKIEDNNKNDEADGPFAVILEILGIKDKKEEPVKKDLLVSDILYKDEELHLINNNDKLITEDVDSEKEEIIAKKEDEKEIAWKESEPEKDINKNIISKKQEEELDIKLSIVMPVPKFKPEKIIAENIIQAENKKIKDKSVDTPKIENIAEINNKKEDVDIKQIAKSQEVIKEEVGQKSPDLLPIDSNLLRQEKEIAANNKDNKTDGAKDSAISLAESKNIDDLVEDKNIKTPESVGALIPQISSKMFKDRLQEYQPSSPIVPENATNIYNGISSDEDVGGPKNIEEIEVKSQNLAELEKEELGIAVDDQPEAAEEKLEIANDDKTEELEEELEFADSEDKAQLIIDIAKTQEGKDSVEMQQKQEETQISKKSSFDKITEDAAVQISRLKDKFKTLFNSFYNKADDYDVNIGDDLTDNKVSIADLGIVVDNNARKEGELDVKEEVVAQNPDIDSDEQLNLEVKEKSKLEEDISSELADISFVDMDYEKVKEHLDIDDDGFLLSVNFDKSKIDLSDADKLKIKDLVQKLKENENLRLKVVSYAIDKEGEVNSARRISLKRAILIRSLMINAGMNSMNINVQAIGDSDRNSQFSNSANLYLIDPR